MDGSISPWVPPPRWRRHRLALAFVWLLLTAALSGMLGFSERSARDELRERFQLRATIVAQFIERSLADQAMQQQAYATRSLTGPTVGQADLEGVTAALGFGSAMLVDERGQALAVEPPAPRLIGTDVSASHGYLEQALREDRPVVSGVVPGAAGSAPMVALAVPFESGSGRRVLSGAIEIQHHPLGDYIAHAVALPASQVHLVDESGVVLASNLPSGPAGPPGPLDPALAGVARSVSSATVDAGGQRLYATGRPVPGTPWRLVTAAPVRVLDHPVAGLRTWGPRGLLVALVLGSLAALVATAHVVDTREALRVSEARYREVFSDSMLGMVVMAPDGRLLRVNKAFCELVGHTEAELMGGAWGHLTHPDDMAKSKELVDQVLAGELAGFTLEKRYLHADGHVVHALVTASLIRDEQGRPLHFATQVLDQTARQRAEQTRASMAAIVESSDDAIIGKDLDGTVTNWNRAAERLYGWTAEEMIGRRIHTLAPDDRSGEIDDILAAIAEGQTVEHYETIRRRKDGVILPVSLTVSPIRDGSRIVGASVIARDMTLRRQWENALADRASILEVANAELREANQLKSDLVAMLSHDVGQPLSVISGYAEMLIDDWDTTGDADRRHMVGGIASAAGRLTMLVDEVLSMAKSDAGAIQANPVPVRVADAVEQAVAAVGDGVIGIVVRPPGGASVLSDPVHLQQVLVNLITNAGKYGQPPVEVSVTEVGEDLVELRVADHGPGVPEEFVPHLFDRFTRAGDAAESADGSGLGLFIVRKLAEANGGQVTYEHGRPQGACFVVSLGRAPEDGTERTAAGALAPGRRAVLE